MSKNLINVNTVSRLFQPIKAIPKDAVLKPNNVSKGYKLMVDMGIIKQANPGMHTLMPLGLRVLQKLINIVDKEMNKLGAQKLLLPNLTNASLWEKTNRLQNVDNELFTLQDRHKNVFILSPTHEEAITDLVASMGPMSSKQLPLMLYQISSKWRDEKKPRLGLFRGREFIMKDLYTFDSSLENAQNTYSAVREAYENIFKHIGIEYTIAVGDTGIMGGTLSHEYHYLSDIGEDRVLSCHSCGFYINSTMYSDHLCGTCHSPLLVHKAVEVGHTFLLGTRYSEPLHATYRDENKTKPMMMGCYGLGLTRLIATAVETLSKEHELRWPKHIAPYTVCIVPPKKGSTQEPASHYSMKIYEFLENNNIDVIIDDRDDLTIGRRMLDANRTGYTYLIVIGKQAVEKTPHFEIHDINNSNSFLFTLEQLKDFFETNCSDQQTKLEAVIA
ncbi:probable proline--tRNA ligase, mitochondrial [Venturia canescens]|uniref:probable proline--tRNA ligase, mitochondrial n=1 Tax=Venturia canescens TaxID=32260 RepID=UPI001C9C98FD|nr:probable proline--tRNA ligase, mitochondrial [Venturia canescens]XP_043268839.1 probable proline--tRNA ligase, mitochondrial [Venturia canescens]